MKYAKNYSIPDTFVDDVWNTTKNAQGILDVPVTEIEKFKNPLQEFLKSTSAHEDLENNDGIIAFDFKNKDEQDLGSQIILATAMFHLVNAAIYKPARGAQNDLPYTTYKSSAENADKMLEAGIKFYKPDQKLGYHNDVFLRGDKYSIPRYVSLINLFIGYNAPGNFYYISQDIWEKFNDLFARGVGKTFKFKPTPVVSENDLTKDNIEPPKYDWTDVPVFWQDKASDQKYVFANGELQDNEDTTIIAELKQSLLDNPQKIAIPQKTNQIMIFRNDIGFHSRDIFKEQFIFEHTTRLFLRSVSEQSVHLPEA